ncbi:MAG: 4Fe-4S binding protein [Collinsella sp.]
MPGLRRSIVDPNKCIGCGLCTTKCAFDAIHLDRDRPECSTMVKYEQKLQAWASALKRAIKINLGRSKNATSRRTAQKRLDSERVPAWRGALKGGHRALPMPDD